jgi:tetratricopeptide (TPR) repeat protein
MYFFQSCHLARQGDRKAELARLHAGVRHDPLDADILIGLFRSPELTEAQREVVQKQIRDAAQEFRDQMRRSPEDATPYNQFAWLIANTEGDKQEALRASQRSLELRPGTAGYIDTLARCYFALGEHDKAFEEQQRAVALEPHSGLMQRQLAEFAAAAGQTLNSPERAKPAARQAEEDSNKPQAPLIAPRPSPEPSRNSRDQPDTRSR